MKFSKLSLAAAVAAFVTTGAQAGTILLDSFVPNQPVAVSSVSSTVTGVNASDVLTDTANTYAWWNTRSLAVTNVVMGAASDASQGAEMRISSNALRMSNGSDVDSTMKVSWGWDAALASALSSATAYNFVFTVLFNDSNANQYNGISSSLSHVVGLNKFTVASSAGDLTSFGLTFDGNPGWDLTIQSLGIQYSCADTATDNGKSTTGLAAGGTACTPAQVPVPGSVALLGLGLLGLGALRRRA